MLQADGYRTGFIGKWHMGNDPTPRPGFDAWFGMKGQGEAIDPELYENGRLARVTGYVTDIFTERALRFIRGTRARPFLLMLSHKALHPNIVQQADGTTVPIGEGGFIPAERHKNLCFVHYRELEGMNELNDLQQDPFELQNLIGSASSGELRRRMEAELDALLAAPPSVPAPRR